jgi:hypothetical protein
MRDWDDATKATIWKLGTGINNYFIKIRTKRTFEDFNTEIKRPLTCGSGKFPEGHFRGGSADIW